MNRAIATAVSLPVLLAALVACSSDTADQPPTGTAGTSTAGADTSSSLPDKGVHMPGAPKPAADGPCPYLDTEFVMDANGQHVTGVKVSADKPHPACFFYRPDGSLQVTVQVYVGDAKTARAIVDRAAPVKTSNPATAPDGWNGGAMPTPDGSIYAVAKGGNAVVTTSNQKQTIKAKRITVQAIESLGL
ncbi:DUF2020 domain-containing protein [Labedaea rhizosphaerae]|uniref:Uncharacterized protein DUF2020 n=1 Tax=Labedaea rhizosphaerae TaxID=598644 RepID=A0A4R6SMN3_LABRH|nr:DUF2020 domain-containing protein [Labedaea rhizosphaerae]TDQ05151.1 uncharacterized protein DUF2020 [Labedaea rhizosphaerae]